MTLVPTYYSGSQVKEGEISAKFGICGNRSVTSFFRKV